MVSRSTTLFVSLLLHLLFFTFFSQSESKSQPPNVSLELYYESLCPYSANFIVNHLPKIFTTDLIPVVDLKFVPWGNAKLRPNATINCQVPFSPNFTFYSFLHLFNFFFLLQHGPNECLLNTVEACAIDTWPELVTIFLPLSFFLNFFSKFTQFEL